MSAPPPSSFRHKRFLRTKPAKSKMPGPYEKKQIDMVHVVNTYSSDTTSPCIMLYTHNHTYVFNCGEVTQRLNQKNGRMPKHCDIFLTRLNWDVTGGLPGYLLTASELQGSNLQVHGPKNLSHFLATFRNYIFRAQIDISINEFDDTPVDYVDDKVIVTAIPLTIPPKSSSRLPVESSNSFSFGNLFKTDVPTREGTPSEILQHKKDIVHHLFRGGAFYDDMQDEAKVGQFEEKRKLRGQMLWANLPPTQPNNATLAYLLKSKDQPGTFDVEKAKALKIPVGKLYAYLKAGNDIEIKVVEDGKEVTKKIQSQDVCGKPTPGRSVLILDLPSVEYVTTVLGDEKLNSSAAKKVDLVVHMLADEVATDPRYINWMQSFKKSTKHLIMAPKLTPDNFVQPEAYLMDLDRNWLDESTFPLSHHHAGTLELTPNSKKYTPDPPIPSPYQDDRFITDIRSGSRVYFRGGEIIYTHPPKNEGAIEIKTYLGNSMKEDRMHRENVLTGTKAVISEMDGSRKGGQTPGHDVQIMTLGTGSAVPNRIRNVSCNILRIPGVGNMFLDCGEGSLASLRRHFSPSEFEEFFRSLRTIFISHLHADHHLGIVGVIRQYSLFQSSLPAEQRQPLFIIAPWRLLRSLYEYNEVENIGMEEYIIPFYSYNLIPQHLLPHGFMAQSLDLGMFQGFLSSMNFTSFATCFVPHCAQAYGVAITHKSGWKIVYSGDCRPSGDLVDIGRDATVLIHEATVAETQPQEALDKMHSTTGEAIMIGKRMNAKHILLTHFSQKWTRIPEFVIEWKKNQDDEKYKNVGIAFDHMAVKVEDMWKLPLMYPAWGILYREQMEKKSWLKLKKTKPVEEMKRSAEDGEDVKSTKRRRKERRQMKAEGKETETETTGGRTMVLGMEQ